MKKIKTILPKSILLLLLFTTVLISCSSDDDDATSLEENDFFFTVKIDGEDLSFDTTPTVSFLADQTGFYNIQGNTSDGDKLALTLISPTATGTFQVSDDNVINAPIIAYSVLEPFGIWGAGGNGGSGGEGIGTIIITENNAAFMEGTFSFTGVNPLDNNNTKEFTEGSFKAKKL